MTAAANSPNPIPSLPDHTQLPESDGTFVFAERAGSKNFQEHPQSILLTDSIEPVLQKRHQDGEAVASLACGTLRFPSVWAILHWSGLWDLLAFN